MLLRRKDKRETFRSTSKSLYAVDLDIFAIADRVAIIDFAYELLHLFLLFFSIFIR
jgi:hypothetical protein